MFTHDPSFIHEADYISICVPTPLTKTKDPDLSYVKSSATVVGRNLKKGAIVILESSVYPGVTEEIVKPTLEKESGYQYGSEFQVAYSPERINPGDKQHSLSKIIKVTSGCDPKSAEEIAKVYELVVEAGVHRASSIKVAEAAKIIENTQRDINIAFMNELSMIFNKMGINTYEVLEAAGTKWNFLKFMPGLVGGHCIGVDPYYLTYKSAKFGHHAQIITSGRAINDSMGEYIAKQLIRALIDLNKNLKECKILILGTTFKENVSDIRNSKVVDVINELKSFSLKVDVVDPHASPEEIKKEYGFTLSQTVNPRYDAILVAVSHKEFLMYDEKYFRGIAHEPAVLFDLKGIYRGNIHHLKYWTL